MAEPVQVRFTQRLRDQHSMWIQDGCKAYMNSYMASNGSCFMVTWTIFRNHLLEKPPNTKPGDHGTLNAHNRCLIPFYHACGPAWIEIHWNSIWLRARSPMASHYTWRSVTTLHDFGGVLGWPWDTLFWALTMPWSRLLACMWSGPKIMRQMRVDAIRNWWWIWNLEALDRNVDTFCMYVDLEKSILWWKWIIP